MIPDRFGKYRVLRRIASGGMAEVYLCRITGEEGFRKRVALKVVHPRHADDPRFRELFAREARLAASLSHPNLVQVFDFGREGDAHFLAMEYVEGWNLAQAAEQARQLHVPISPGVWRHWVDGIGSGLAYLHEKGIVHRDVSPANVLVARNGAVKITDFGISLAAGGVQENEGTRAGKSGYLAPERIRGEGATSSTDLFAAGVISVELLLGQKLFEGDGPEEILERIRRFDARTLMLPGVSSGLVEILRKSVAAHPADRYPRAADFLVELARVAPPPASAPVMTDFWDALFPDSREEETAPDPAAEPESLPAMVKEPGERYGGMGRTVQAGAAVVFAAVIVGGVLLWKEVRQRPTFDAAPASVVPRIPVVPAPIVAPTVPAAVPATVPPKRKSPRRESLPPVTLRNPVPPASPGMPVARLVRIETDPPGASVLLESGASIGKTPLQMDVASLSGRKVVLSKDGYERQSVPADALAAGPAFRVELQPLIGTVEAIQAIPWAKVYLGNRLLGETPLTAVRLPAGEQRLRFVNEPLGVDQAKVIVVRPGDNPKIIVPMTGTGRR
ncbi:protein kinase domain-containing protein [Candidatus Deferrimicrobium sp.]|uniref:serine/threonine protein kinase n=1 Tax=Candidatus Deferrimicrobium sp. TaxID=3060586 RepID=UPI003C48D33B